MGYEWQLTLMKYGPTWRLHRKTLNKHFNQGASMKYINILNDGARDCLVDFLREPKRFTDHIH